PNIDTKLLILISIIEISPIWHVSCYLALWAMICIAVDLEGYLWGTAHPRRKPRLITSHRRQNLTNPASSRSIRMRLRKHSTLALLRQKTTTLPGRLTYRRALSFSRTPGPMSPAETSPLPTRETR